MRAIQELLLIIFVSGCLGLQETCATSSPTSTVCQSVKIEDLGLPFVNYIYDKPAESPMNAKFYNFHSEDLLYFWYDGTPEGLNSGGLEPATSTTITTYPGHIFMFRTREGKEITRFLMEDKKMNYLIEPQDKTDKEYLRVLDEINRHNAYFERTGYPWLATPDQPPTSLFMWDSDYIGQTHTVMTEMLHCHDLQCDTSDSDDILEYTLTVVSTKPRVFYIPAVLNDFERNHILELAMPKFHSSSIGSDRFASTSKTRTSKTAWLAHETDPIVKRICTRIMHIMGLEVTHLKSSSEAFQVVRYLQGESYEPHYDFSYYDTSHERYATFGTYILSPEEGGATSFPYANKRRGLQVKPEAGGAVLFYNVLPDGNGDFFAAHSGMRVTKGRKIFSNLWVHDPTWP